MMLSMCSHFPWSYWNYGAFILRPIFEYFGYCGWS